MIMNVEQLAVFEELDRHQERVYNDACDVGVVKGPVTAGIYARVREALRICLADKLLIMHTKRAGGQSWRLWFPIEHDEGRIVGTIVDLSWNVDRLRKVEFLSVDFSRGSEENGRVREDGNGSRR